MAISTYDINRDMYGGYNAQERYEYEMFIRRHEEEEYRRQSQYVYYNAGQQQAMLGQGLVNAVPKPDPKDPLSFLSKADNKLLLTGEAA